MAGFLDKVTLDLTAHLHSLIDADINRNSIPVMQEQLRRLEAGMHEMNEAYVQSAATVVGLDRQCAPLRAQVTPLTEQIQTLAQSGDPEQVAKARAKALQLLPLKKRLDPLEAQLADAKEKRDQIKQAIDAVQQKHTEYATRVHDLQTAQRMAQGQDKVSKAVEQAGQLVGSASLVDVDNVEANVQRQKDVSDARFQLAMGNLTLPHEDVTTATEADLLFEQLTGKSS